MTHNSRKMYYFVWKIDNFSLCNLKNCEGIDSPQFTIESLSHSKWYLVFYPKGNHETNEYLSLFLYRDDGRSAEEKIIDYKLELVDGNGTSLYSVKEKNKTFAGRENFGSSFSIKCDFLSKSMKNWEKNILTISCEISSKQYIEDKFITCGCKAVTKIGFHQSSFEWILNNDFSPAWIEERRLIFLPVPIEITLTAPEDAIEINIRKGIGLSTTTVPILIRFSLQDVEGKKAISKCDTYLFTSSSDYETWNFPLFLTKKQLEDDEDYFVQASTFTLYCEIFTSDGTLNSSIENYVFQSPLADILRAEVSMVMRLQDDLRNMFSLKKHCDVKLQVGNNTFPAHKAVLAARSPVFSAMFDQDMLENQTGVVVIDDVEASTMHELLECIYTGSVKEMKYENVSKLLIAADKYQILSLK